MRNCGLNLESAGHSLIGKLPSSAILQVLDNSKAIIIIVNFRYRKHGKNDTLCERLIAIGIDSVDKS